MVLHVPSGGHLERGAGFGLRRGNEDHRRAVAAGGVRVQAIGLVGRVERLVPPVVTDDPNELTLCRDGIVALHRKDFKSISRGRAILVTL